MFYINTYNHTVILNKKNKDAHTHRDRHARLKQGEREYGPYIPSLVDAQPIYCAADPYHERVAKGWHHTS